MKIHYNRCSSGEGFTLSEFDVDMKTYINNFTELEGDSNSRFAIILLSSDVSHTNYNKIIYSNDIDECEQLVFNWLNRSKNIQDMWEVTHFYSSIVDFKQNKELAYGDSWNNGSASWQQFNGISEKELIKHEKTDK